ncbi:MAG: hypothetical protein QF681_15905 [Vicinamibacterales bacterium]|nr:hypothetical protein [Vicinamibacterales bacterium]
MSTRHGRAQCIGSALLGGLLLVPALAAGQQNVRDLQGVWDFRSVVPFERPEDLAGKETFTAEEAAAFEQQRVDALNVDLRRDENGRVPLSGGYNNFWYDRGTSIGEERRTSLVVDPPDGRMPARTDAARARNAERGRLLGRDAHGPEDRGAFERCILGFNSGPPMNPSAYNNNMQLFQTDNHVVILNEMVHDSRVIPLDGSAHLPDSVRQWMGDSRGHWDGNTLVVETRNFTTKTSFRGSGPNMQLVERFTRADADTLVYEYTVTDPESFARPWSARTLMKRSDAPVYEYACHEGNYGMDNLLVAARDAELKQ